MAQQALVSQGLLTLEASRRHSDTPQSVGLLWTSDQPDADNSTYAASIKPFITQNYSQENLHFIRGSVH
jgi:hypothetical protein